MNIIEKHLDIEFISLYGHLSYTLTCPHCREKFERHAMSMPHEIICPYCKAVYRSEGTALRRGGIISVLTYGRSA